MSEFAVERARQMFQARKTRQGGQPQARTPQLHTEEGPVEPGAVPKGAAETSELIGALHFMHSRLRHLDLWLRNDHQLNLTEMYVLSSIPTASSAQRPVGRGDAAARLAKEVELSPSGLTRLVTRLVKRGLLTRAGDVWDKRVTHLVLTEQGRAVRDAVLPQVDERLRRICGGTLLEQVRRIAALPEDRPARRQENVREQS
jgi:DNA-binding MarR family transcriptional regulator